jgi:MHS family proline/betaine transporter-like MFS transporter
LQPTKPSKKLIICASTIGNVLEWYDFALFLYLSPIISTLFFPKNDSADKALINLFIIFFIGCFSRPLGGLFFGYIGDRYGRRLSLLFSIVVITIPTFLISFLPTYEKIGYWAPILLCILRFFQGVPLGGEFPGTLCYLMENAEANERGSMSSFAFLGICIGVILSVFECLVVDYYLTEAEIVRWGWRLSFFLAGLIGLTGLILRFQLKETPLFQILKEKHEIVKAPIHQVFKKYKQNILFVIFIAVLPLSSFYFIFTFTEIFLDELIHTSRSQNLMISGGFILECIVITPFWGFISGKFGFKKLLLCSSVLIPVFSFYLQNLSKNPQLLSIIFIESIIILLCCFHFAVICQSLCGLFPTAVRFSGMAFGYNICSALFAGAVPFLSISLFKTTDNLITPYSLIVFFAVVTFVGILPLKEKEGMLILE